MFPRAQLADERVAQRGQSTQIKIGPGELGAEQGRGGPQEHAGGLEDRSDLPWL